MTDILLIQPPVRDFYLTSKRTIPYGLASIAASLIKKGFSVDIIDALASSKSRMIQQPEEMAYLKPFYSKPDLSPFCLFNRYRHFGYSFEHIGVKAREHKPFLVGISSLFTPYAGDAADCAGIVKKFHPDCKIVMGGHHPTVLPEAVMENKAVDFLLRGEGEISMPLLAAALKTRSDLKTVPGIVFRKDNGGLYVSDPVTCDRLDHLPHPATNLLNSTYYDRKGKKSLVITASRGCPMNCSYCATGAGSWLGYRRRRVDSVVSEISEQMQGDNVGFIDFEDENLTMNRKWFMELMQALTQLFGSRKPELRAMNGLLPSSLDDTIVRMMTRAGFKTLNLSLGSASKDQLARFHRPDVRSAFDNALHLARTYGLGAVGYIIAGAPFQDPVQSVQDLIFFAQREVLAGVSVFYPAPGSRDYGMCGRLGLLPKSFSLMRSTALPISHTTTRLESITILRLARILNFMKLLVSKGIPVPEPVSPIPHIRDVRDREQIGIHLLRLFLKDGRIRGLSSDGAVYDHPVSKPLVDLFLEKFDPATLKGC